MTPYFFSYVAHGVISFVVFKGRLPFRSPKTTKLLQFALERIRHENATRLFHEKDDDANGKSGYAQLPVEDFDKRLKEESRVGKRLSASLFVVLMKKL
ncbi:hypothetical protein L596_009776 [Steinernema carpocapsae]|uniref:Uncharacterized protein n=1 Tax=Steinernema carpocapsae TaxID=34508 RepID=A0A4V6A6U2_STECR|nr:hypothetical protein L596_009776 [Steinernema carpocapsae]